MIGKRIIVEGDIGTIKYFGTIEGKDGEYFGVEWDDPLRGKHSGSVNGVDYFQTRIPNSGSFFNIKKRVDFGRGFVEALREKYLASASTESIDIGTSKQVELVGWEKQQSKLSRLDSLLEVGLSNMRIHGEDNDGIIETTCPLIQDLDLSRNLFSNLLDVQKICKELKYLRILRLNNNRFIVNDIQGIDEGGFESVKILTVMGTFMEWSDYVRLGSLFPLLEEFHLGCNRLGSITNDHLICKEVSKASLQTIKVLNLERNEFKNWDDIALLASLPVLENLNLADNHIESIHPPKDGFKSLLILNLNRNRIHSWMDIHTLNDYTNLTEIRIAGNPICDTVARSDKSTVMIARLKHVKRLNGSEITMKSRRDSEYYYLNMAHKDLQIENFEQVHPRYRELCELHGTPVIAKLETTVMDRLVTVKLLTPTNQYIEKKVPKQTQIRSFKTIAARTIWPSGWQKAIRGTLVWMSSNEGEMVMDDELKSLDFFGITNEDCFRIEV